MAPYHYWLLAAGAAFIAELLTTGFFLLCLALACLVAALVAFLHGGLAGQFGAFAAGSLAALYGVRPLLVTRFLRPAHRSNVEALVGKSGRVLEAIDPVTEQGRVLVEGEDWWAASLQATAILPEQSVRVVKVDGSKLIVEAL